LVATTEIDLRCIPNFGKVSLKEVKEMLGQLGLRLGMAGAPDAAE
jgi:DNA-directed RNA polymerase alpha subunit